jgi:hypothetical protein
MNTAEIGAFIREPHKLGSEHVQALKNLCEIYPYSGMLYILYLKALGNSKSVEFESHLKHYAIHIPNRALLFHLIHDEEDFLSTIDTESSPIINQEINHSIEPELPKETENIAPEFNPAVNSNNKDYLNIDIEIQPVNNEESEIVDIPFSSLAEKEVEIEFYPGHSQKEDSEAIITQSPAIEHIVETPIQTPSDESAESEITIDETSDDNSIDNTITFEGFSPLEGKAQKNKFPEQELPLSASQVTEQLNPINTEDGDSARISNDKVPKKSFYDWLTPTSTDIKIVKFQEEATEKREVLENNTEKTLDSEHTEQSSSEKSKEKVQALVDKFIREEPRISRPKAEFFSPTKNAKESVNEDGIPVSETLAKIYELQGNFPKAIQVYEKLKELMPQKTNRFSEKIAELKNKI